MRDHILDRLAFLADTIIHTKDQETRANLARAAMSVALTHHRTCPPAEGSL